MPIITLTSDWGNKDSYKGAVKGAILSKLPGVTIVDITHQVPAFDIEQAAFILRNAWSSYPAGTVHIIAVNAEESIREPHTAVLYSGHYFIAADNGIFSLIFDHKPEKIVVIDIIQDTGYFTFPARDRFVEAAVRLAGGDPIESLGEAKGSYNEKFLFEPVVTHNHIRGIVVYVDAYENAITNIRESLFREHARGRKYQILFRTYAINRISRSYSDVNEGDPVALFGTHGYLEIAMNKANASALLGLYNKESVVIEFAPRMQGKEGKPAK